MHFAVKKIQDEISNSYLILLICSESYSFPNNRLKVFWRAATNQYAKQCSYNPFLASNKFVPFSQMKKLREPGVEGDEYFPTSLCGK